MRKGSKKLLIFLFVIVGGFFFYKYAKKQNLFNLWKKDESKEEDK